MLRTTAKPVMIAQIVTMRSRMATMPPKTISTMLLSWPRDSSGHTLKFYTGADGQTLLSTVSLMSGMNYGSVDNAQAGIQKMVLVDGGNNEFITATGKWTFRFPQLILGIGLLTDITTGRLCIASNCPNDIHNMNYQVVGLQDGSNAPTSCTTQN